MILTRATDNRLKTFFTSGEVRYERRAVPGQGLSLARTGGDLRRRRSGCGAAPTTARPTAWTGDVVAPIIRDLGVALAMSPSARPSGWCCPRRWPRRVRRWTARTCTSAISSRAFFPPAAPLAIGTLTLAGMALAFARDGLGAGRGLVHRRRRLVARRVARGDQPVRGAAAAGDLLRREQPDGAVDAGPRAVRRARVRRQGGRLRHPGHHASTAPIPTSIAAAFAWAAERARAGLGPALIELVAMRMCGHAHHDDMLYLGRDPPPSLGLSAGPTDARVRRPRAYAYWSASRSDSRRYAARLRVARASSTEGDARSVAARSRGPGRARGAAVIARRLARARAGGRRRVRR